MYHWRITNPEMETYLSRASHERAKAFKRLGLSRWFHPIAGLVLGVVRLVVQDFICWHLRRVTSYQLMGLDDQALKDIGVSRGEIPFRSAQQSLHCLRQRTL